MPRSILKTHGPYSGTFLTTTSSRAISFSAFIVTMPHHWQDDAASGYTISTRVPCEDSATIFKQDCTRKETDTTLSFFGLHQNNTEQNIGEPGSDLGFPSLWYSALFDVPDSRTSTLQFNPRVPELILVDADLWSKFHEQGNEMIITKSGRCLFPCLRFKAVNLDPTALYTIYLDFELTDIRRFKFEDGGWRASSTNARPDGNSGGMAAALAKESYTHPDKYQTGAHWMKGTICFDKAKLSNSRESAARSARRASNIKSAVGNSHHIFHMSSFHKYRPQVHLVQRAPHSNAVASSTTYTFHQTSFIAVTHYQNSKVNDLKKGFNPHARGFRGPAAEQTPPRFVTRSERTRALKRRYSERDTSDSDAADETDSDQSRDDDVDDDDLDSDLSTPPEMTRTSSSETSEKSSKSFCRLNKDNCALVSISISQGKILIAHPVNSLHEHQEQQRMQHNQFVYWDQPSQALAHQAIQQPVLPTAAQSSSESNSCLMLPFAMDKSLDYVMLHRPPQTTPSGALSGTFVDTTGSAAQETLALDTPDASALLGPHTHMVKTGTRHTRSQVHIRAEEGSASSRIQSNPTTTFTTILESRTLMSTTSDRAILPSSYSSTSAHLEHALRENLRLKAFIRARYGSEAEAEANAVMAMERRQ
ncbi:T-box transcription factor tbx4 [Mortierella alpina]|nr:T-box transcription factor tbx4 [Mortierella alpina]